MRCSCYETRTEILMRYILAAVVLLLCGWSTALAVVPDQAPTTLEDALRPCLEHLPEVADSEYLYTEFDPPNLPHAYRGVPRDQLDKVVASTTDAGGFTAFNFSREILCSINSFCLTDDQLAQQLPEWLRDGYLSTVRLLPRRGIELTSVDVQRFEGIESDIAMIIRSEGRDTNNDEPFSGTILRVVRGGTMIEVSTQKVAISDEDLVELVELAFSQVETIEPENDD